MLRAEFRLPSITAEEATPERKAPIRVKFEIPYFTVSGIQVMLNAPFFFSSFFFPEYLLFPFLVFCIFHAVMHSLSAGVSPVIFIISMWMKVFFSSNLFSLSLYSVQVVDH